MNAPEYRTQVVAIANQRGGKDTIHRTDCRFVLNALPGRVRLVRTGDPSHRIYTTCGVCLKGLSTFRLPTEPAVES
jgi:hypothetical protein